MIRFIVLMLVSCVALATTPTKEPEKPTPAPTADSTSAASADANATQGQSQNVTLAPAQLQTAGVAIEYPAAAVVFGMGQTGGEDAPISNGPCPLWVPKKPSRSFPGHGRGPKYERDEECWAVTVTELDRAYDLELERLENERTLIELERQRLRMEEIRLEECLTCDDPK